MPKKFIFFLVVAQAILTIIYWLAYEMAVLFFPALYGYHFALAIIFILLSFSCIIFLVLTHRKDNFLLNLGSIFSMVFLVFVFYFLLAAIPALLFCFSGTLGLPTAGYLALAAAFALTVYGIINARIIRVKQIKIQLPNLPEFWKNKTAVMASDLHLGQILRTGFAKKIVAMVNAQNPEIVFIPGDFYDGVHTNFQSLADEFSSQKIKAPLGVYFCSGNHELFAGYKQCKQALKNAGIKVLENQLAEVQGLQIAGVAYKNEVMNDLLQTLQNLGLDKNKPSILLKHVPLQLKEVENAKLSLVLCGHSHHGQIWPGRHITKKYFSGFDYGLKKIADLNIYTSSGAGTWGPPMRVFTKPEIVKIIFV